MLCLISSIKEEKHTRIKTKIISNKCIFKKLSDILKPSSNIFTSLLNNKPFWNPESIKK